VAAEEEVAVAAGAGACGSAALMLATMATSCAEAAEWTRACAEAAERTQGYVEEPRDAMADATAASSLGSAAVSAVRAEGWVGWGALLTSAARRRGASLMRGPQSTTQSGRVWVQVS